MRTAKWIGAAAVLFCAISLMAQQANVSAQQSVSAGSHSNESGSAQVSSQARPGSASVSEAANSSSTAGHLSTSTASSTSGSLSTEDMRSVSGELENKLDSKTARVGDRVVLKTSQKIRTADGTVIPKGTRLIGHVTDAEAHNSAHAQSQLGLEFDRAELKNGQSVAIHSTIRSVEPRANAFADDSMAGGDAIEAPVGGGAMGGGARAGGGGRLVGGGAPLGGAVDRVGSTTARTGAGLTSVADGTAHAAGGVADHAVDHTVAGAGAGAHAAGSAGGSLAAHATGVPGVMLQSGASGSFSGMLSASKRNVHLDSGTQMELGIVAAARQ
jgi:hypothetical protein